MRHCVRQAVATSAFLGLAALTYPAAAHHSTTMFDKDKVVNISGTVTEVQWVNPHVAIYVETAPKAGEPAALWVLELTSPGNLVRSGGWSRTAVKPGDKVTVDLNPLRDGNRGGALKKITIIDTGASYTYDIRAQEKANLE